MRRACVFACLLLSAGIGAALSQNSAPAETPSGSRIEALLKSGEPLQVAWGAHYVLTTHNQALLADLVSLADNWEPIASLNSEDAAISAEQFERRDAMAAVLDALIQMKAQVPVVTLRSLAADFPAYVAVLLSRLPLGESQALSWEFYHAEPHSLGADDLQYVSAALLAEAPPAGFAADLLSSIHVQTTISIEQLGKKAQVYGVGGPSFGCGPPESRKGWPEFGVYIISEGKMAEGFALFSKARSVSAYRRMSTHYAGDRCEVFTFAILGPEERRELIAQMLDVAADDIEWGATMRKTMEFQSEAQFDHDLLAYIASRQEEYRATAEELVAKNLMTIAEGEDSLPRIDLQFLDQRGPGFGPVAQPQGLPAHVVWTENRAVTGN